MGKTLGKIVVFGFSFGCLFALFAYLAGYEAGLMLFLVPVITASLSLLGGLVAALFSDYLQAKTDVSNKVSYILSYLAAAVVNTAITIIVLHYIGNITIGRETIIIIMLGLAIGGLYGIYQLRSERVKERMRFLEELAEKNRKLQETTRRLAITEERNRMSRELHDSISQGLHGLIFTLRSLRNELKDPPDNVKAIVTHMEATAHATLDELRNLIEELKPSLLAEQGLSTAIESTADLLSQRQAIPVEVKLQIPEGISPEREMTIYRIVQEALANIEKHAAASHVQIHITENNGNLLAAVTDDGRGFNRQDISGGNGLRNMQQRAEEAGGDFSIISKPKLGTTIKISFPPKG